MSELFKTEALVLQTLRWSESSKIVSLFTPDRGLLKAIARGALRPRSEFRGVIEPLNHIETIVSIKESRGLQLLTSASLLNAFLGIREDLNKTAIAFSILELIKYFFKTHEPVKEFFHYTIEVLQELNDEVEVDPRPYLWHFLFKLSKVLGFGWSLEQCLVCEKPARDFPVWLDLKNGGFLCPVCAKKVPGEYLRLSREQWKFIQKISAAEVFQIRELAGLYPNSLINLTEILLNHLAYHTETPVDLKSLKLYQ